MSLSKHLFICLALCMCASTCFGAITFVTPGNATVGGVAVSASAELSIQTSGSDSFLKITLTNLSQAGHTTQRLTNFEFDLVGASLGLGNGAGVHLASGSTIINDNRQTGVGNSDVSGGWVWGTDVTPYTPSGSAPTFDYGVSATSFINGNQVSRFDGSTHFGNNHDFGQVNGGTWGLLGVDPDGNYNNDTGWVNVSGASIINSVDITLKVLSGTLSLSNIGRVAFTYGSEMEGVGGIVTLDVEDPEDPVDPVDPVPEPTTVAIWGLGMGLSLVGARFRRKRAA